MKTAAFPFQIFDWIDIKKGERNGDTGKAYWQIIHAGNIRVRLVEYSPNYRANHWCNKGHVIHCIEGEMNTQLEDGRVMQFSKGMTYIAGDNCEAHRSSTINGCKLFIAD